MASITFTQFLKRLALGQFRNLALVDENNTSLIKNAHRDLILLHTNDGLKDLHTKYVLLKKDLILNIQSEVRYYYLRDDFKISSASAETYKYIDDTIGEAFLDDVIRVLKIFDPDKVELYINDTDQVESIMNREFDCLKVPETVFDGLALTVTYQACHPVLVDDGVTEDTIRLPYMLEDALAYFVASKVLMDMGSPEQVQKGMMFGQMYEAICLNVLSSDLASTSMSNTTDKLDGRGFV